MSQSFNIRKDSQHSGNAEVLVIVPGTTASTQNDKDSAIPNNDDPISMASQNNIDVGTSAFGFLQNEDTVTITSNLNNSNATLKHTPTILTAQSKSNSVNPLDNCRSTVIVTNNLHLSNLSEIETLISPRTRSRNQQSVTPPDGIVSGHTSDDNYRFANIMSSNTIGRNVSTDSGYPNSLFNNSCDSTGVPSSQLDGNGNESGEICNFQSLLSYLGDAINHVKGIVSEQYKNFVQDCREQNSSPSSGIRSDSFPGQIFNPDKSGSNRKDIDPMIQWILMLEKRILDLENVSFECFQCSQLMARKLENLENDFNQMKPESEPLVSKDSQLNRQAVLVNFLEQIIFQQKGIQQGQDQIKKSLENIRKNQESVIKAQMIIYERFNTLQNGSSQSTGNRRQSDDVVVESRPNLSFYNFQCVMPDAEKFPANNNGATVVTENVSDQTVFEVLDSKESFKSTIDHENIDEVIPERKTNGDDAGQIELISEVKLEN